MRKLIVRNVKSKDEYRNEIIGAMDESSNFGLPLSEEAYIPYALMEKAIYQILEQGDRTFIANVKQSFTSSFEAVKNSSIMERNVKAIQTFSKLDIDKVQHPKLSSVCDKAVDLLMNGEKVLIFCDRIETMTKLRESIKTRLNKKIDRSINKMFPDNKKKGFDNYCKRFYSNQDISWFLLQENYIHSVLMPVLKLCGINKSVLSTAKDINDEVNMLYKKYNTTNKTNYMYVKRIVENIVFRKVLGSIKDWYKYLDENKNLRDTVYNIMDSEYVHLGLNLERDEYEDEADEEEDTELRNISNNLISNVLNYKGIWVIYSDYLNLLQPKERDNIVNAMIQFLRRDHRFFIQLRYNQEKYPNKRRVFFSYK